MSTDSFTVTSQSGNVICTSRKVKEVRGAYGCQKECKTLEAAKIMSFVADVSRDVSDYPTPAHMTAAMRSESPAAYHIQSIVCNLSRARVAQLIQNDWLYCKACSHGFHPFVCQGKIRKICPCCTTRLNLLKTALKKSTVQKIQDTVLIHRID